MDETPTSPGSSPVGPPEAAGALPVTPATGLPPVTPPDAAAASSAGGQKSRRKWLWGCGGCGCLALVLVVVLVFALAGGSFVGSLFGGLFGQLAVAKQTATGFIEAMRRADYGAAYDYLSSSRQAQVSREDFINSLKANPGLARNVGGIKSYSLNSLNLKNSRAVVSGTVTFQDGRRERVSFFLVQESGKWKIDRVEGLD